MGSGKSTVGRELAYRLDRPFIDLDSRIERSEGCSIDSIFAERGEPAFREAEHRALAALPVEREPVVAPGGGIVLRQENLDFMARTGIRVWLKCPLAELLRRLELSPEQPDRRPLWTGDRQDLERLLEERTPLYAETADLTVDATVPKAMTAAVIINWLEGRGS